MQAIVVLMMCVSNCCELQLVSFGVSGLEIRFALTLRSLTCARLVLHLKACQTYLSVLNF